MAVKKERKMVQKVLVIGVSILLSFLYVSCLSTGKSVEQEKTITMKEEQNKRVQEKEQITNEKTESTETEQKENQQNENKKNQQSEEQIPLKQTEEKYKKAQNAISQGDIAEGIFSMVSLLGELKNIPQNSDSPAAQLKKRVLDTISEIENKLSFEVHEKWKNKSGEQIEVLTTSIGGPDAYNPSLMLTMNTGGGRSVVSGIPIQFSFNKGNGVLNATVTTDEYGNANTSILKFDDSSKKQVITAIPVVSRNGYSYTFSAVTKDFVYVPPERTMTLLGMDRSVEITYSNQALVGEINDLLKTADVDFAAYDGELLGEKADKIFGGEPEAVNEIANITGANYLGILMTECYDVNQLEYGGKKYDIYKSLSRIIFRILDVSNGSILYSASVDEVSGQGGRPEMAVRQGVSKAGDELMKKLDSELTAIKEAFILK